MKPTVSVYKEKRGWYRILVFSVPDGLTIYKIKGKKAKEEKLEAIKKIYL